MPYLSLDVALAARQNGLSFNNYGRASALWRQGRTSFQRQWLTPFEPAWAQGAWIRWWPAHFIAG
eukprot:scaffold386202_cov52-Prasinocladus_malaysianus.AAC.1